MLRFSNHVAGTPLSELHLDIHVTQEHNAKDGGIVYHLGSRRDGERIRVPKAAVLPTRDVAFGEGIVRIPRYNNVVAKATYGFAPTPHFQR